MSINRQRIVTLSGLGAIGAFVSLNMFNSFTKSKRDARWHNHWEKYEKSGGKQNVPWDGGINSIACKYLDQVLTPIVESAANNSIIKIFVPLCGSSQDMIEICNRLSNMIDKNRNIRFQIFGVDLSEIAIKAFFTDKMKISLQDSKLKITNNIKSKHFIKYEYYDENNNGYCLFAGDLFNLCIIDEIISVDLILDVNSLVALNLSQRNDYAKLCAKLLKKGKKRIKKEQEEEEKGNLNGRILLQTYWYDPSSRQSAPWPFNKELVEKYYSSYGLKVQSLLNPPISFEMYPFYKDKLKSFAIQEAWLHVWLLQ